jgi:SdpI/YhfL family protein
MNGVSTYYFISGLALALAGVPLLRGWIPRNRWAGFRVPKTLSNDEIWYEANRVAGRDLMIAGAVIMTTAGLSAFLFKAVPGFPLEKVNKVVFYGGLFGAALHSFIALRRM